MDVLFHTDGYVFSYRVAGICIKNKKVLLQKPTNDTAFAFPGGHVSLGETNAQTLIREFKEEMGVDISVDELKWVGEIFFTWDNKSCHQICLFYSVDIISETSQESVFVGKETLEGKNFNLEFYWVPLADLNNVEVYPKNAVELIKKINDGVQHFINQE